MENSLVQLPSRKRIAVPILGKTRNISSRGKLSSPSKLLVCKDSFVEQISEVSSEEKNPAKDPSNPLQSAASSANFPSPVEKNLSPVKRKRVAVPIVSQQRNRSKSLSSGFLEASLQSENNLSETCLGPEKNLGASLEAARKTSQESGCGLEKGGRRGNLDKKVNFDPAKMTMKDFIYNNPNDNFMKGALEKKQLRICKKQNVSSAPANSAPDWRDPIEETAIKQPSSSNSVIAPQIKIGSDGKVILNEESLFISAPKQANSSIELSQDVVYENSNQTTYFSYSTRSTSEKWSSQDTLKFFRALSQCGTDFSLIEKLFPTKSRRQIKNKFKKEEKTNKKRIEDALSTRIPIDCTDFIV
eukprot:Sdes_comp15999_c0_seq1m5175